MSQVLYRKYRPQTFDEVEGQEHVVQTLKGAVGSGRIGHAYLFAGPRGTGKTTMARLLAKALNCAKDGQLICNKCSNCSSVNENRFMDLIEIDAASNRGIDEIRNIKDSAQVASSHGGYKIFIIDEVHMLTPQAFNALLKVLEEPPSHVVFILATTEPHKVIDTILSRVQRFDFRKLTDSQIASKINRVAKKENIVIDSNSVSQIVWASEGSLRDAENALAKLVVFTEGKITSDLSSQILGIVPSQTNKEFLEFLFKKDTKSAIKLVGDIYESGLDLENFVSQFLLYLRRQLLESFNVPPGEGFEPAFLASAIRAFIKTKTELKTSPLPQLPIELAVWEITQAGNKSV
ncbi:MAG: hypothetical protein COV29_02290 [Candidatus Yanofskybacteria bacterium CG10_big_fil_rev_8_21_14_0_10_36_16]|uniref:DNA polymerase III subunit gamma/tau n=1 Tax=Candidatus Yanofskybacteria bacterium CG10_big_fil_rev_8_21_14_0_10_36_16 TaxID=1975096 RepID=A0A2J0Q7L8_9BACT|nr:MAG: hypothetical protein COV29_02290 [Candidatus Yanofskybacteria bacterium CG10_big_fil_rev_8_21_14_0_10_36_16]